MFRRRTKRLEIFKQNLTLFWASGEGLEDAIHYNPHFDLRNHSGRAYHLFNDGNESMFAVGFNLDALGRVGSNTAAHEAFHLTNYITNHLGIDDEETSGYLIGYLTEMILKESKKAQNKFNNI